MKAQAIRTDYDSLAQIARGFEQEAGKTRLTLDQLHKDLDVLLDGDWVGKGATEFYREMISDVLPSLKRLGDALDQAARAARQINRIMKRAEDEAARLFSILGEGDVGAGGPGGEAALRNAVGRGKGDERRRGPTEVNSNGTVVPTPGAVWTVTHAGDGVRVRSAPGTDGQVLDGLPVGTQVTIVSAQAVVAEDNLWFEVQYTPTDRTGAATAASPDFPPPLSSIQPLSYVFGSSIDYNSGLSSDYWKNRHPGVDYAPPGDGDQIVASASGTVVASGSDSGYGNYAIVEYPADSLPESMRDMPGYEEGGSVYLIYAHMAGDGPAEGTELSAGDVIGQVGSTGNSSSAHLHLEVRVGEAGLIETDDSEDVPSQWWDVDALPPVDPGLIFEETPVTGWVAARTDDGDTDIGDETWYLDEQAPEQ